MKKSKSKKKRIRKSLKEIDDGLTISAKAGKIWNDQMIERIASVIRRNNEIRDDALLLYEIMVSGPATLEGEDHFYKWLTTPKIGLGRKIPLKLMICGKSKLVRDLLLRIDTE